MVYITPTGIGPKPYDRGMRRCALAITVVGLAFASLWSAAVSHTQASVYEAFDAHGDVVGHVKVASATASRALR